MRNNDIEKGITVHGEEILVWIEDFRFKTNCMDETGKSYDMVADSLKELRVQLEVLIPKPKKGDSAKPKKLAITAIHWNYSGAHSHKTRPRKITITGTHRRSGKLLAAYNDNPNLKFDDRFGPTLLVETAPLQEIQDAMKVALEARAKADELLKLYAFDKTIIPGYKKGY